jgi:3-oxoacyl-[acyl-carrier-protein] synthase II
MVALEERRIVVTGVGVASPVGIGLAALRCGLLEGRSGIRPISLFDTTVLPIRVAAEVLDYSDELLPSDPRYHKILSRQMRLGLVAAADCIRSAGLGDDAGALADAACLVAVGRHDINVAEFGKSIKRGMNDVGESDPDRYLARGVRALHPLCLLSFIPNLLVAHIGTTFGLRGEANTYTADGAAALQAIGDGAAAIREGLYDVALCGGCDARIDPLGMARWMALGLLAEGERDDTGLSMPFDRARRGYVLGEGAVFLMLEEAGRAARRGARALAEVSGSGGASDGYPLFLAHPEGRGLQRSMRAAVDAARVRAGEVDLVVAAACSLPDRDAAEGIAIASVFPEQTAVTAPASMLGRSHAAGGAFAAATAIVALGAQAIPPTINTREPDATAPAGLVTGDSARPGRVRLALANGYALGGQCASVVFREVVS